MIDSKLLDALAKKLSDGLPAELQMLHGDLQKQFRVILESGLSKLDVVAREEFDLQRALLARTREKLDRLEQQIAKLESKDANIE